MSTSLELCIRNYGKCSLVLGMRNPQSANSRIDIVKYCLSIKGSRAVPEIIFFFLDRVSQSYAFDMRGKKKCGVPFRAPR